MRALLPALAVLAACATDRAAEDWADWYAEAAPYDVQEPIAFTDAPYDFTGHVGIADLPLPDSSFETWFSPDDAPPEGCPDWVVDPALPAEIEGIVTVHPRFYYKTTGCAPGSDEKFYGSYFIQDATGGIFVLGDSKVAHFDMGDRVRMKVRATRHSFDLPAVAVHDIVEVDRGPYPIHFEPTAEAFGFADIGVVKRIEGTVTSEPDTFGEFQVEGDDGATWAVGLDVELNRRGVRYPVGSRIQATGPILYSYGVFSLVVMRVGQIEEL